MVINFKVLSEIIIYAFYVSRDKAPGQKECDETIDKLNMNIRDLDQASLSALDQNLQQQTDNTVKVIFFSWVGGFLEMDN